MKTAKPFILKKETSLRFIIERSYLQFAEASRHLFPHDLESLHQTAVASIMEVTVQALFVTKGLCTPNDIDPDLPPQIHTQIVSAIFNEGENASTEIGAALELLRGRRLAVDQSNNLIIETSTDQRSRGVYFTPPSLAKALIYPAVHSALLNVDSLDKLHKLALLDPAAGCGAILISILQITVEILKNKSVFSHLSVTHLSQEVADNCIYGVDIDPVAIATTRALLIAEVNSPNWEPQNLDYHLHIGDSICARLEDWKKWFPERATIGFNVVATNPPWNKLRPIKHEYFEHIDKNVRLYQGKALGRYLKLKMNHLLQDSWKQYVQRTLELSSRLRKSNEYVVNQKSNGDPDLYKYFLERSIALLAPNGIAALLLPSGFLRAQGSAPLRHLLFEHGSIVEIVEYINKKKIFDIHSMYRFVTLQFKKGSKEEKTLARFGEIEPNPLNSETRVSLDSNFFKIVGGEDLLIPEVRNEAEKELLIKLYKENPTNTANENKYCFKRELDMTNDSAYFIEAKEAYNQGFQPQIDGRWLSSRSLDALIPVYEGRMVNQYDNVAKEYHSGSGRSAKWNTPRPGHGISKPHYFVTENYAISRGWTPTERVGYCEISGHANERTIQAALIPAYAICGNKVPVLRTEHPDFQWIWLAVSNSLVIDWIFRRWISTTINQFYWKNIPFPAALKIDDRNFLKAAASILSKSNMNTDNPTIWLGKRAQLRAAIDAVVMNSFGITIKERETILNDFPILTNSASRGASNSMKLNELLTLYIGAHSNGSLNINNVHTFCDPLVCSSTYATKAQAIWW